MMKRIFLWLLAAVLLACSAMAEEASPGPQVKDVGLDLLGSSLHYPQVIGLEDPAVETAVNNAIMEAARVEDRINRMTALISAPVKMQVSYAHALAGDVFSCAFLADGAVETTRATQVWSTVNLNLRTGEAITLDSLFTDPEAARAHMEALLTEEIAPEQSAHLPAGDLIPLPEEFSLSPAGLTLYYPIDQFCTLSGRAGTVTFLWTELRDHLDLTEGGAVDMLGADDALRLDETSTERIAAALAQGSFPGVPAHLGQSVKELTDLHRQLTDNELCEAGRMFILEDGAFRQVFIITDALTDGWDESIVSRIRADRLNLHGLCTGYTTLEGWRAILGEPDATANVGADEAGLWRIAPGVSDYYTFGEYRLRLHADETGVLRSVFLMH